MIIVGGGFMRETNLFLVSGSLKKSDTPEKDEKIYVIASDITEALEKAKKYFNERNGIIFDIESKSYKVLI